MPREVSLNAEQELFVIPSGDGYSCFGFRNCFDESKKLSEVLGRQDLAPKDAEYGTLEQYADYRTLVGLFGQDKTANAKTWFSAGTTKAVESLLEEARTSNRRLRIHYGDVETGRAWSDRPESGRVGRSMGPMRIPILIKTSRSTGGEAIMTSSIVRVDDVTTKATLFRHPAYHEAPRPEPEAEAPGPSM